MTGYQVGEIVDIAIKGVRVVNHPSAPLVRIADEHGAVFDMPPQAAIERVAPAQWPPQVGDLWRDREGDLWFAHTGYSMENEEYVDLRSTRPKALDGWHDSTVYHVLKTYGPLTLVHREAALGGGQ